MAKKKNVILIVDDSPNVVSIIIEILSNSNKNYLFLQANNGHLAYQIAIKKLPDLIITDWDMPIVNGIELINLLKNNENTTLIPIIMATAVMQSSEDLKTALNAGAVDYIKKPIDPIELYARVKSVLKISEYNKSIIDNKNEELTKNTLILIKNNKFNLQLINKLEKLKNQIPNICKENIELINSITQSINEKVNSDSWQKFEMSFKSVHNKFIDNLLVAFPNLTSTEIKLCIFLRLGMSTKDISSILFQSPGSVKVNRSRLRKKLNLNSEQNLSAFLYSI